jgi:uncharacterized protein YuzB (UPF0349 family)
MLKIRKQCHQCHNIYELEVIDADYRKYQRNEGLIQNIFPYLSKGDRELLLSGYCNTCFEKMFADSKEA